MEQKKLTNFDKTHTVKYTRKTYYWEKGFFFFFFFLEKKVWFHETNGLTLHIGTNKSILTKVELLPLEIELFKYLSRPTLHLNYVN